MDALQLGPRRLGRLVPGDLDAVDAAVQQVVDRPQPVRPLRMARAAFMAQAVFVGDDV